MNMYNRTSLHDTTLLKKIHLVKKSEKRENLGVFQVQPSKISFNAHPTLLKVSVSVKW